MSKPPSPEESREETLRDVDMQSGNNSSDGAPASLPRIRTSRSTLGAGSAHNNLRQHDQTQATERTSLLGSWNQGSPRYMGSRTSSPVSVRRPQIYNDINPLSRSGIYSQRGSWDISALNSPSYLRSGLRTPKTPKLHRSVLGAGPSNERVWYDQFTSTDWVRDSILDGHRVLELRKRKDFAGRLLMLYDAAQGWILVAIIGGLTATVAYFVDILEGSFFDWKRGYCGTTWYYSKSRCCAEMDECQNWRSWSDLVQPTQPQNLWINWVGFILCVMFLAGMSCFFTLFTKTVVPSHIASTFDENLGAENNTKRDATDDVKGSPRPFPIEMPPPTVYYSAAGSGVAEVKVILSGFVLHGYLGFKTLIIKTLGLILAVASGMSLGKEGPYVHIATCMGNIACRLFPKYNLNDAKRREVLSASAASGVAVAFGSPLGGVLFSLEEVSYYFPPKTLFRTFFCCIVAALSLKFLNPYGTNKIVLFEVRYVTDWRIFELACFALVGVLGGTIGALFIKASRFWATTFRRIRFVKAWPMFEVLLVAFITGLVSYWNRYANLAVTELLLELASPCTSESMTGLCPQTVDDIPSIIRYLLGAFLIKAFLTVITFGIKVPAGIYVPSMVVGGLMGRIIGHMLQYVVSHSASSALFGHCSLDGDLENCITPGVYALVAAGATMCGVTRLSVTLAVILFELTGSLDHVLPFSLGVLCAKWTADYIEPHSIYDLLIDMNSYPFMDNRDTPVFDTTLSDITRRLRGDRVIDISISPLVKATELRVKLNILQNAGEIDGGLPIIRDKTLVGLIPAPDLEFALDKIETEEDYTLCLMSNFQYGTANHQEWWPNAGVDMQDHIEEEERESPTSEHADLTPFIDPAPIALDVNSPMDLVYQCFVKLGLRYVCVVENGEYTGMVHKKGFVRYVKESGAHGH